MDRLPTEMLFGVFGRLDFKDKLQCALTCRDWYTKISSTVLYSKISFEFPQSNIQTKAHIKYIRDKHVGHQVKDLHISDIDDPLALSELCPNLTSLQVDEWDCNNWDDCNNAPLAKNWKKVEHIHEEGYFLTMKLLDAPFYMASLTSLTISLYKQTKDGSSRFFKLLKHAPVLDSLTLSWVFDLNYKTLDLLHENTPNLKHLELKDVNYNIAKEGDDSDEHRHLSISSVSSNLRSISATFQFAHDLHPVPNNREINSVYWIAYICRKYPNLTSITVPSMDLLASQHNNDIIKNYVKKAFCNWTQLEKFDVRPVYLTTDILQAMDYHQICLKELNVYIAKEADMEQFSNLAHSNQRDIIQNLTMNTITGEWVKQEHLAYFLQSLDNNKCQLKSLDISANSKLINSKADSGISSPIQVLDYIPSLEKLTMRWIGTKEQPCTTHGQTTRLKYLHLELYHLANAYNTLQHTQVIIHRSPLLQSLSIFLFSKDITLDFQQNPKFTHLKYFRMPGDVTKVVQNNQTTWYTCRRTGINSKEYVRKELQTNDSACRTITLHLSPIIQSLYINNIKIQIKGRRTSSSI